MSDWMITVVLLPFLWILFRFVLQSHLKRQEWLHDEEKERAKQAKEEEILRKRIKPTPIQESILSLCWKVRTEKDIEEIFEFRCPTKHQFNHPGGSYINRQPLEGDSKVNRIELADLIEKGHIKTLPRANLEGIFIQFTLTDQGREYCMKNFSKDN